MSAGYKSAALPVELIWQKKWPVRLNLAPHMKDHEVGFHTNIHPALFREAGFEPTTPCIQNRCPNQTGLLSVDNSNWKIS